MPFVYSKERKQNEKNSLIDFSVKGTQITLQSRPSPPPSRPSSRLDSNYRPMSATPTLCHRESRKKTPPWTRPQSADHLSTRSHKSKPTTKFEGGRKPIRNKSEISPNCAIALQRELSDHEKSIGSMSNLLESCSLDDHLDSENSMTPSPVPSLTDVLRSTAKLEPGLAAKPPIPSGLSAKPSKSMEDIINIKFQRWFPESVQNGSPYKETLSALASTSNGHVGSQPEPSTSKNDFFQFDAYEPRADSGQKVLSRSRTMETIVESDDAPGTPEKSHLTERYSSDILTSNLGKTLNKYLDGVQSRPQDECQVEPSRPSLEEKPVENGLPNEDTLTWVEQSNQDETNKLMGSTYDDILNMLKVLEKEEVESLKHEAISAGRSGNNSACSNATNETAVGSRDILSFLDEVDRSESRTEILIETKSKSNDKQVQARTGRLGRLLNLDPTELSKKVMTLTIEVEERDAAVHNLNQKLNILQEKLNKQKSDCDAIVKRHQKFIDQLLSEKRILGEQCASVVKEMEAKNNKTLQTIEERHNVEMKKLQEKILSGEKLKRDKWLEEKTKKIKEQTVKGLEPELERMTRAHQEELTELRRAHDRELVEMENSCARRLAVGREQALREREQAVQEEREAAAKKLDHELSQVERNYQEQRRRLMNDVREEKLKLEKENEAILSRKSLELEEKWRSAHEELKVTLSSAQEKHQAELRNMRETLEAERNSWLTHQVNALSDKEAQIREQCKKERDRHLEGVIRQLDQEAREKEKTIEAKLQKLKDQYESDIKDLESTQIDLRRKLKESRAEAQQNEENLTKYKSQINQLECKLETATQKLERTEMEGKERGEIARSEVSSQITALQRELADEKFKREELISALQAEKERELQQVYNRVKEAISKKEETLRLVQKQRDAALEQCSQLEDIIEQQRKDFTQRKIL